MDQTSCFKLRPYELFQVVSKSDKKWTKRVVSSCDLKWQKWSIQSKANASKSPENTDEGIKMDLSQCLRALILKTFIQFYLNITFFMTKTLSCLSLH